MNTLLSPPLSTLLPRLFDEADATQETLERDFDQLSPDQRQALLRGEDWRALYERAKDAHLAVSRETGRLLYLLARASNARTVVEFGTSFGVSTLHLAAALRDNGGGRLIGSEFEPGKVARARANVAAAGLDDLVEIRAGDALETLARDLPEAIDLVLLDGAKALYSPVLDLLEPHLRPGALIVADNADMAPDYLARIRGGNGYLSLPFDADVELSLRL
ncbi:class I SAM-dependent methyltransferase [Thermomonas brevis]|uniref:Class I SAM-dependent methyltransferase n=1 Tax=Thermomonas brevis TaxID=215691 RepID=A0A7G9QSV3_9GAMM|nr:class I SAM-dependent methyltransferase [Thermomonas brevis]QNN46428.1 class I SAM-dependent methyltransferase [Thermomonas brevis]